jgi:hypothetical protein
MAPFIYTHHLYFGTVKPVDMLPQRTITNSRFTAVPNLSRLTSSERDYIMRSILEPIQVVIRWQGGEERLLIPSDQIRMESSPPE